jgi:spoIIIJ-associated protein
MQSVEIQARSVDEAVQIALGQLGRRPEEVEIEVLNAGTPGVLGVGAENAVVRVTVRGATGARSPLAAQPPQPQMPPQGYYQQPMMSQPQMPPQGYYQQTVPPMAMGGVRTPMQPRAYTPQELANIGRDVITNLLRRMRLNARTQIDYLPPETDENGEDSQSPVVAINLMGSDLSLLIGRRGEVLTDLQYMFNLIMNKRTRTWGKVMIDVEGYRQRRKTTLINLAQRMAEQVLATRQPITLEPMPAYERRLVHMTLVDHPYIRSESFGEGEERKITIFPK